MKNNKLIFLFCVFFLSSASSFDYLKTRFVTFNLKVKANSSFYKNKIVKIETKDLRQDLTFLGYGLGDGVAQGTGRLLNNQDIAKIVLDEIIRGVKIKGFKVDNEEKNPDIMVNLYIEKLKYEAANVSTKFEVTIQAVMKIKIVSKDKNFEKTYKKIFQENSYRSPSEEKIGQMFSMKIDEILNEIVVDIENF